MKIQYYLKVSTFFFVCILFVNLTGCNFSPQNPEETYKNDFSKVDRMAFDFNHVADFPGNDEAYLQTGEDLRITINSDLDSCLEQLCVNYQMSTNADKYVSADQIREALKVNTMQTLECYEEEKDSFYLYEFFKWCGELACDNLVYVGDPSQQEEIMGTLKGVDFKNWQVVYGEMSDKERNVEPSYKFKWQ